MTHASEFRRCLVQADVPGIMAAWKHVAPHLADISPAQAMITLHIARVEAKSIPLRLKAWSRDWLSEQGYRCVEGKWIHIDVKPSCVPSVAVGIASCTASGHVLPFNRKVHQHMEGALLNALAKGITEPPVQREVMLKAREKVRFKAARV